MARQFPRHAVERIERPLAPAEWPARPAGVGVNEFEEFE
jgi:hypothetical protein